MTKLWNKIANQKNYVKTFKPDKSDFMFNTQQGPSKGRLDKLVNGNNAFLTKSQEVADQFSIHTNYWYNIRLNPDLRDMIAEDLFNAMQMLHTIEFKVKFTQSKGTPLIELKWLNYHAHLYVPNRKKNRAIGGHCWRDNCSGISVETHIDTVIEVLDLPRNYDDLVQYVLDRC
tara:strand:- start:106 stop:624 length:519 start_codon:yes stop_codon:yes gene_type:complete